MICLFEILLVCWHYFESAFMFLLTLTYIFLLLPCHGDIELNPGSQKLKPKSLLVSHWNFNSLSLRNFSKLTQLKVYISMYKHDFICLSETYLDSPIPESLLEIDGYNLLGVDHPNNIKRGGVCIYYKESLAVRVISLPDFKEALLLEMTDNNKKIIVSVIYRSPNHNNSEFHSFLSNLEQLLRDISKYKRTVSVITADFNARSLYWSSKDINTSEETKLYSLTSSNGFLQLINEPTHIQTNSSSCTDLVFIDQFNRISKFWSPCIFTSNLSSSNCTH